MAYGIWTQPVGPGPATPAPLFIDSGSTFPQFKNSIRGSFNFNGAGRSFPISGWDGSGQIVIVPTGSLCWQWEVPPNLVPDVYCVNNIYVENSSSFRVTLNQNPGSNPLFDCGFNVYQIWPRADRNYGITFSNTADYFSISDSGVVGQCIWAWQGTINNALQIPNIGGFNMTNAVVFANWSDGGIGLSYTSDDRVIRVYQNRPYINGNTNEGGSVFARIAVFCNGAGVPEHNGGLNIYSPGTTQCVFSTNRTPFTVDTFIGSGGGNTGMSYPMIPLTSGIGAIKGQGSGWRYQQMRSHTMSGSSIGTGYGRYLFQWDQNYDLGADTVVNLSVPVINAAKVFAGL